MKQLIAKIVAATPVYPHWLEFRQLSSLRSELIFRLQGQVLEVGAGDGSLKIEALARNSRITSYVATDYSSWDAAFEDGSRLATSLGFIDQLYLRKERAKMDRVCSALDLPFPDNSFDWHVSSEVLEHIDDPRRFFSEAARVLKPGGAMALTAPFMYRIHPDMESDFFRVLPAGYRALAAAHGLVVEEIASNTGVGASLAAMVNQKLIRNYDEASGTISRVAWLLAMPLVFVVANLVGFFADLGRPDGRFASRFLVVIRKPGA